jgi:uncharacterized protein involved in exopolysaccharide biosynthesis
MQQPYNSGTEPLSSTTDTLPSSASTPPGLLDYIEIIVRRWKMITVITVTVTLATVMYALTLPNIYTAKTKILPPQQSGGLLSAAMMQGALAAAVGGGDLGGLGDSKSAKLYTEMLKIEGLRDPIIERFKLQELYKKKFREDVYKQLQKTVTIQAGKEGIITIAVDDKDPKRAADMANAFVDELKKLTMQMSMTGANNSKAFLEERMAKARADLSKAENDLKTFQSKYKTIDATQQVTVAVSAIAQLTGQLTSQEVQLAVLRRTFADSSQEVKALLQSISVLRGKVAALQSKGGSVALPGFEQLPERGQEYLHLMRAFKTAEAVHDMLVRQFEVSRLNAENDVSTIQVIQKALVPQRKSKPARSKLVMTAAFASFFFSLLLTFIRENVTRMSEENVKRWKSLRGGFSSRRSSAVN